ncbi:1,4-dihydroxy-2-naphthoate polyprenyltransferase [Fodinisporobacter ferrooxydans]|uniref:1,4-dihydroxy-2-naphthoate octaprenyltransferase n=1 Tax=Fodinisporobacter ferrooxydans TaxID=2901836 RepID=A0ABY4CI92_9BACL|nr:1,4-dihydroxy-2-naphthoate polyprenyltransferase [Alicyclobacillaceae bacterium MYW30-H2]
MGKGIEPNQPYLTNPIRPSGEWKVWWRLLRPHTLTASFVPVGVGTALALQNGHFHLVLFLAMMIASILIQAATNMFNEYFDYVRGLDTAESIGIGGAIVREGIKAKTVMTLALAFYTISILIGVYICYHSSWWIAAIGLICMAVGYFYTGGPYPIAYTPFGELFAGFFMGCIIILISYYIQTGTVTVESILVSMPALILVGAILMANNIRDLDGDKEFGRQTLAILLGREKAIRFLAGMFVISYIWMFVLVVMHIVSPWLMLVFASVPKAIQATRGFRGKTAPIQMLPAMKATAQTNTQYGFFLALGLLLTHWI